MSKCQILENWYMGKWNYNVHPHCRPTSILQQRRWQMITPWLTCKTPDLLISKRSSQVSIHLRIKKICKRLLHEITEIQCNGKIWDSQSLSSSMDHSRQWFPNPSNCSWRNAQFLSHWHPHENRQNYGLLFYSCLIKSKKEKSSIKRI